MSLVRVLCLSVWLILAGLCVPIPTLAAGPEPVLLWPDGAPGAAGTEEVDKPSIRVYPPAADKNTGAAVVICPGGGYGALAFDHEGHQVGQWFQSIGITGVVLKYRLAPRYRHPAPLQDVQRAIRHVRAHAGEWNVDVNRVGVMGFSAGGHLASTVSTHYDLGQADAKDLTDQQSCRPSFSVLCYPVISFTQKFSHRGSANNLLGPDATEDQLKGLSNETQVTKDTPPAFLFHTAGDTGVPPQNSIVYYQALLEHGVSGELHIYQTGPHGVGLAHGDPVLSTWKSRLEDWLRKEGWMTAQKRATVKGKVMLKGEPLKWGTVAFISQDATAPTAWGMVSRGDFSLSVTTGPLLGLHQIVVHSWGNVEPRPTLENVTRHEGLPFEIQAGENTVEIKVE